MAWSGEGEPAAVAAAAQAEIYAATDLSNLTEDDWNAIKREQPRIAYGRSFLDDSGDLTMLQLRSQCRRVQQRHDLSLLSSTTCSSRPDLPRPEEARQGAPGAVVDGLDSQLG
ncbi:hypothetical protein GR925_37545 [Streptomyces sp. HUCO-GS316]|uniref:DnaB-like helicase C-terminal domain-containing protein n=1 Tax=Streptomyces sp. HUCO-GS316 TaxID=2692198 RepID=UPI00136BBA7F|nr:DnaB-like helicase C-terminal domain-containing protein [Streptomyces sp. HUCO-GS316]MXM68948.1 hypothetical protein [Streptomyces sp. HUCO-GS316]